MMSKTIDLSFIFQVCSFVVEVLFKFYGGIDQDLLCNNKAYDTRNCGVSNFFDMEKQGNRPRQSFPNNSQPNRVYRNESNFGNFGNSMMNFGNPTQQHGGLNLDPRVQKLTVQRDYNGAYHFNLTRDQVGAVIGEGGCRIQEIQKLSGAVVEIERMTKEEEANSVHCLRGLGICKYCRFSVSCATP